jgi:hypothetical protein
MARSISCRTKRVPRHPRSPEIALREMARVVRRGGSVPAQHFDSDLTVLDPAHRARARRPPERVLPVSLTPPDGQRPDTSHEILPADEAQARARNLAHRIDANAPPTNQLILAALPRISDKSPRDARRAEALTTALTQSTTDTTKAAAGVPREGTPHLARRPTPRSSYVV